LRNVRCYVSFEGVKQTRLLTLSLAAHDPQADLGSGQQSAVGRVSYFDLAVIVSAGRARPGRCRPVRSSPLETAAIWVTAAAPFRSPVTPNGRSPLMVKRSMRRRAGR